MKSDAATKSPAPRVRDRSYHHGNLRAAAIDAAVEALGSKMPSEISLRELAKTIGVGHSALYAHFRDRDELFAMVSAEGFDVLRRDMVDALIGTEDATGALACAYLAFARANPEHYRTMFRSSNVTGAVAGAIDDACNGCLELLMDAIVQSTGIADDEAQRRAIGIWCALHGLVLLADRTGPLREKFSADQEIAMARAYTKALVDADRR